MTDPLVTLTLRLFDALHERDPDRAEAIAQRYQRGEHREEEPLDTDALTAEALALADALCEALDEEA